MNASPCARSEERVRQAVPDNTVRYLRTETSSVTSSWGVNWSETLIARDIIQNFYDANRESIGDVRVAADAAQVVITAPNGYNLQRLFYLGSEKGPEEVGQYGEGFKVAATCLLRDHRVAPVAVSGNLAVCLRIAEEPVAGTRLFPLVYDFFELEPPCSGTRLILSGCSVKLVKALQEGLTHFFYPGNTLLGERLWISSDRLFMIFASRHAGGHVFYRNLLRGDIPHVPLILVIQKEFNVIEQKIKNDRDRNAFGEKLLISFYKTFARNGVKYDRTAFRILVKAGEASWEQGHALLSAVAECNSAYSRSLFDDATVQELFGDKYFARSHIISDSALQLRCGQMEAEWERAGRIGLPGYFANFGVISAQQRCEDLDVQARQESQRTNSRPPSPAERASIRLLDCVLQQTAPAISAVIVKRKTTYTVARTDVVLGELKRDRGYRSVDVFLAEHVFVTDFAEALAIFLHEHAHIFGHDGDRGFTDALTELLETVVRFRTSLDRYEAEWERAREEVYKERQESPEQSEIPLTECLASLTEAELRTLLQHIPAVVVRQHIK